MIPKTLIEKHVFSKMQRSVYDLWRKKLTKKIHLIWEADSKVCFLYRINNRIDQHVMARKQITSEQQLNEVIEFFIDKE